MRNLGTCRLDAKGATRVRTHTTVMQEDSHGRVKPFEIPKRVVWEAWKRVSANNGAAGVDGQSIDDYRRRLGSNLYSLWNRMSSGSYQPRPVRQVLTGSLKRW